MKKIFLILSIALFACGTAAAQDNEPLEPFTHLDVQFEADSTAFDTTNVVLIVDDMAHAIVHQDSAIRQLMMDKRIGRVRGEQRVDGFRVQIYASNTQQIAKVEAITLQQRVEPLLSLPVYTISEPPFWKVRIGNFKTREEANQYKAIFLELFPDMVGSTYVVPDKIVIIQ